MQRNVGNSRILRTAVQVTALVLVGCSGAVVWLLFGATSPTAVEADGTAVALLLLGSWANAATAAPTPNDAMPSAANTSLHPLDRHPAALVACRSGVTVHHISNNHTHTPFVCAVRW